LRFIHIYLIAYFALVAGAFLALWRAGVLARVPSDLLLIATIIVVGLGVLVAVTSTRGGRIFLLTRHAPAHNRRDPDRPTHISAPLHARDLSARATHSP